jgi:formate hydrogenlyase subunit 4
MVSGTAQIPYKIAKAKHCSQIIQEGTVMEFIGAFNALKGVALMENDFRIF